MAKRIVLLAALILLTGLLYLVIRPQSRQVTESDPSISLPAQEQPPVAATPGVLASKEEKAGESANGHLASNPEPPQAKVVTKSPVVPEVASVTPTPTPSAAVPKPEEEIVAPADEVENVRFMVRGYRDAVGENPQGNNSEITKALMGDNARQVKMPLPVGSHVNEKGELADRWNTPYFFHQLSSDMMEIRSAGPDQQLWSRDDIVTR